MKRFFLIGVIALSHVVLAGEFDQLVDTLSSSSVGLDKAKKYIDNHPIKSEEVKQLLDRLSFDSYKLQLAKYAYKKTIDKENYLDLIGSSLFLSSKNELKTFIKSAGALNSAKKTISSYCSGTALDKAKKYCDENLLTAAEVKELIDCLSFDSDKLKLAKHAYKNTLDKENYVEKVGKDLFLTSKNALRDFIR